MWKNRLILILWLLFTGTLYFFENNTGTRILLISGVLVPMFSVFCAVSGAKKVSLSLTLPADAEKGRPFVCRIALSGSPLLRGAVLCAALCVRNMLTGEELKRNMEISFGKLAEESLISEHCGCIRATLDDAVISDWFGLWRSAPISCEAAHAVIAPKISATRVFLTESFTSSADGERYSSASPGFDPSETFSIREYLPGDPIRRIHWKLSQKTDKLMVRELGLPVEEETLLLLETSAPGPVEPPLMDACMEMLLSVSAALAIEGTAHSLCWKDRRLGEPVLCRVCSERDFSDARAEILCAELSLEDESIGSSFTKWFEGRIYAHTVVFSPHVHTDALALLGSNRVSLLVPESAGTAFGSGDINLIPFYEDTEYIEI